MIFGGVFVSEVLYEIGNFFSEIGDFLGTSFGYLSEGLSYVKSGYQTLQNLFVFFPDILRASLLAFVSIFVVKILISVGSHLFSGVGGGS